MNFLRNILISVSLISMPLFTHASGDDFEKIEAVQIKKHSGIDTPKSNEITKNSSVLLVNPLSELSIKKLKSIAGDSNNTTNYIGCPGFIAPLDISLIWNEWHQKQI